MFRLFIGLLVLLGSGSASLAQTYYVAVDGRATGNGSREEPWPSVAFALERVGGGHTIAVRPGIYRGPIEIPKEWGGTKDRPTVLRSEIKQQAVIFGAPDHVIVTAAGCDYVTIDGFEVSGARDVGIKLNGDYNVVRNCWVHNNGVMGIAMHDRTGGIIEDNLVEYNGCHPQFHHGIYADGTGLTIQGNIVRHNASYGIHLYPSLRNSTIANNLVHGHSRKPGVIVACPEEGGKNLIVNNTIADNKGGIEIWHGNGEVVANNIIVSQDDVLEFEEQTKKVDVDHNLCVPAHKQPHGVTGDPAFLDAEHGVFWLRGESPALGRGSLQHAPRTDFWGRTLSRERAPDLGAFPFVSALVTEQAAAFWRRQWAYHHTPEVGRDMPDLWLLPKLLERQ